jgi:hypothetical protein
MPASPAAERAFRRLRHTIGEAGGSAQLLRAEAIEGGSDLVAAFNEAREREYAKILAGCGDFAAGIENMTTAGHFRYSDLGEKDADLKQLTMRNDAIRMRDSLSAAKADSALSSLARCRVMLDSFAGCVYQADAASTLVAQQLFQPTIRHPEEEEALGEDDVSIIRHGSNTSRNRGSSGPEATRLGRAGCGCGGPWCGPGSRRWWCRRGSGRGSSPTGG